jgi:predicted Zn-dependent protease with MMP-like domain
VVDIDEDRFEELVIDALDSLPADLARHIDNVAVMIEDGQPQSPLLGLYQGYPLTQRSLGYSAPPDRITIYRLPICARCADEQQVGEQVRRTVVHEVGHHFGISDHRLRELGW